MSDVSNRYVVVVVDDQPIVREFVRNALERCGHAVLTAADAESCLRLMKERDGAVDLVLSDIVMPGMGGTHLAEILSREYPGTRVLLMTGMSEQEIPPRWSHSFLCKPFSAGALYQAVAAALQGAPCRLRPHARAAKSDAQGP